MKAMQAGQLISGKYRIERLLGQGAMGFVFEATHVALRRRVALKFLNDEAAQDKDAVRRFLREARAAAALRSEHVVRILDVAEDEDNSYIVMECLDGEDLAGLLKRRQKLSTLEAIDCVLQAGEALAEAHVQGIVHRDLKPANLFVSQRADGSPLVKVVDFGISKLVDREGTSEQEGKETLALTNPQRMMGSPLYMAPEQMLAATEVDARADLWSLGVILYELIGGSPPFDGKNLVDLCMRVVNDSHPPLRTLAPDVPARVEAAIDMCLRKNPMERPDTLASLAAMLSPFGGPNATAAAARIAAVQGVSLKPTREPELVKSGGGAKKLLVAGGLAVVAITALAVFIRSSSPQKAHPPEARTTGTPEEAPAPTIPPQPTQGPIHRLPPPVQPPDSPPAAPGARPTASARVEVKSAEPARVPGGKQEAKRLPSKTGPPDQPGAVHRRGRIVTDL